MVKTTCFRSSRTGNSCKFTALFLAFSWFGGLILGMMFVKATATFFVPLMRGAAAGTVSIRGLLASAFLPFFLSGLAALYCRPLVYFICFLKAFSYGCNVHGVALAFGNSSWLIRPLLLFSDSLLVPILYLYWLRVLSGDHGLRARELGMSLIWTAAVVTLDLSFVSPFLTGLMRK